ncbi:YndJ family protein [Oceanobacillus halotolerans]|uniref:YndJ family protein n=1 Tax=Oceanobacillus halotolerans TaxID=2663380 RepID=UPI0013D948B7|nr:YndJ family protein [Oceanobacillus halotolerans]
MPQRLLQIIHSYIPIGFVSWLLTWPIPSYQSTERIILFAAFVVVPLTLFRVLLSFEQLQQHVVFIKLCIYLLPVSAISLMFSFLMTPGILSGFLSIPWCVVTFAIAWKGTQLIRSASTLAEISKAIAFIYISIGGIWLVGHQFSMPILGFKGEIMLLTVNHFHYAGFVVPILLGYLYPYIKQLRLSKFIVILGMLAPIAIALGMTYSSILEWISVILYTATLLFYSTLVFIYIIPKATGWTKGFHIASSGIVWVTMALAVIYGYGQWIGSNTISIAAMVLWHGWGNAIIFAFLGILAWHTTIMDEETERIPFSKIQGKGKIGHAIFDRLQVVHHSCETPPTGLIDNMQDYKSETFDPCILDEEVIDFYEHTENYELLLTPHWSKAFAIPAKLYKLFSNRVEQMNFPLKAETTEQQVASRILPIIDGKDSRKSVRAWVRTYTEINKTI